MPKVGDLLKSGDCVGHSGYLVMPWTHSYDDCYIVVDLSSDISRMCFLKFGSREEAILGLEVSGKRYWNVPFEADLVVLWKRRVLVEWNG